jgi:hypothetical protein
VAVDGDIHLAAAEFHVQDIAVDAQHSDAQKSTAELQFSLDAGQGAVTSDAELTMLPEKLPCFSAVSASLDWFGSMCLSACTPSGEDAAFSCDVPLPSKGTHCFCACCSRTPDVAHYRGTAMPVIAPHACLRVVDMHAAHTRFHSTV